MANINKIRISGSTFDIEDKNAAKTVTLTQAEYDALTVKDPNVFYVISDSEYNFDGYWTSAQTQSAITQSVSGKADTSAVTSVSDSLTAHTANTTVHVTAQDKTNWNNKSDFSGDYDDLTNKPTIPTVPTNVSDFTNDAGYITSDDISGKTNQSDFTAHTANTTVHVTASEKSTWNSKSDFSGNYNDLSNKPTIPTSASQLTNDSGYITSSALDGYATEAYVTAATNDMATKTWVGQQGYLTQHQDISGKQDVSGMTAYTTTATTNTLSGTVTAHTADTTIHVTAQDKTNWNNKSDFSGSYNDLTDKLSAGTNITIVDNVISAESGGGGKAISGGTNISITSGETADTINCILPLTITGNDNSSLIRTNQGGTVSQKRSFAYGTNLTISPYDYSNSAAFGTDNSIGGQASFVCGRNNTISNLVGFGFACGEHNTIGYYSTGGHIEGGYNNIDGQAKYAHSEGYHTRAIKSYSHTEGFYTIASNQSEHASGQYNISSTASTTFGNSGNTLFSVGNGTADNARHNAFEIRQNGDIYCSDGTNDVKLQDTITATAANTTALGGLKLVKMTQSEYDALATKDSNTLYVING